MVKDRSDSEGENPLPPLHGLLFRLAAKVLLYHLTINRIAHTTAFGTPVVGHWLEGQPQVLCVLYEPDRTY